MNDRKVLHDGESNIRRCAPLINSAASHSFGFDFPAFQHSGTVAEKYDVCTGTLWLHFLRTGMNQTFPALHIHQSSSPPRLVLQHHTTVARSKLQLFVANPRCNKNLLSKLLL